MPIKKLRIYDPLYGPMELSKLEYELVMSPEIQRLRYVRLCNINSLLVSGASEISRFEHILGVLRLAKEWIALNGNINDQEAIEFVAAAILHDFQTGPFGHSLQYVLEDNESDERFIHDDLAHGTFLRYHQTTDANAAFCGRPFSSPDILEEKWEAVAHLIRGEGPLGPLISGSMDLDNIDNVIRLAYHVGVANTGDAETALELARHLNIADKDLICPESSVRHILRWHEIRKRLYELLLLDWAEFSAKAMLTKAMELASNHNKLGSDTWLKTDLELYQELEKNSIGESQEIGALIKRIKCGDLYEPMVLSRSTKTELYKDFSNASSKRAMEEELSISIKEHLKIKTSFLIHPILDVKKTLRSVTVRIAETNEHKTIGTDSNQLLIGVFIPKPIESKEKIERTKKLVNDFLNSKGLTDLTEISDPILESDDDQSEHLQLGLL